MPIYKGKNKRDLKQEYKKPEVSDTAFFPAITGPKKEKPLLKTNYETGPDASANLRKKGVVLDRVINEEELRKITSKRIEIDTNGERDDDIVLDGFQVYSPEKGHPINDSECEED